MRNLIVMVVLLTMASAAVASPECIGEDWCPASAVQAPETDQGIGGLTGQVCAAVAALAVTSATGDNCCFFHETWDYPCYECCDDAFQRCLAWCFQQYEQGGGGTHCETDCENVHSWCDGDCNSCVIDNPE